MRLSVLGENPGTDGKVSKSVEYLTDDSGHERGNTSRNNGGGGGEEEDSRMKGIMR